MDDIKKLPISVCCIVTVVKLVFVLHIWIITVKNVWPTNVVCSLVKLSPSVAVNERFAAFLWKFFRTSYCTSCNTNTDRWSVISVYKLNYLEECGLLYHLGVRVDVANYGSRVLCYSCWFWYMTTFKILLIRISVVWFYWRLGHG